LEGKNEKKASYVAGIVFFVAGTRETIDFLGLSTQEDVFTSRKEGPVPGTK